MTTASQKSLEDPRGCQDCLEKYTGYDGSSRCRLGGFKLRLEKDAPNVCRNFVDTEQQAFEHSFRRSF